MNESDEIGSISFRLYVAGAAPHSLQAIELVGALCERHLAGRFELEVIDLYERPELARAADIVALPALVREFPLPRRMVIGDFVDEGRVLRALGLHAEPGPRA